MIDSHCHLADEVFAPDLDAVVARAREAGVERALVILAAGDAKAADQAQRLEQLWPEVRFAVGVHPHQAHAFADSPERAVDIVKAQIAATPSVRAIGEIGLDYHYDFSPPDVQRAVFRSQIRLARELQRPVVIHTREADEDTVAILRDEGDGEVRGVLHCFTGDASLAPRDWSGLHLARRHHHVPQASELRTTVGGVPLNRLLTETDSPYLAPVPHRGGRNEPAHVARIVAALATLLGVPPALVAAETAANFHALFHP